MSTVFITEEIKMDQINGNQIKETFDEKSFTVGVPCTFKKEYR